ncbi:PucR family transcriptional regulator [Rhodococcus sp. 077-4]|uniref:PucR family transcriptional regulator n=1 Tax=Rhodococcus sp. 077-4 TaxID=2789271 RepID=UPI0039F57C36
MATVRADPEWPPLREQSAQRVWREVLQPLATRLQHASDALAVDAVTQVRTEVAELLDDVQARDEAIWSTAETLRLFAALLEDGKDPAGSDLPPSTVAIMRSAVRRQTPLAWHSRTYRLVHAHVWRWLHHQIAENTPDGQDRTIALDLVTTMMTLFADRALTRGDEAYEVEREVWSQGAAAARVAAIDDVLADRSTDVPALSARLRYDLTRHHVGVVVWLDHAVDAHVTPSMLSGVIAAAARANGAESSITHPLGSAAIAGWFGRRHGFEGDVIIGGGSAPALPPGVRVAVGQAAQGIAGFRMTHVQAEHGRRVAALRAGEDARVTRYPDVALIALCIADPKHAAQFVEQTLGRLAEDDDTTRRLAASLQVYMRENRSRVHAAAALSIHPNTVSYRVRQAEALLGRSIDENSMELSVALTLLPVSGPTRRASKGS